jgi:hypothetical protein
MWAKTRCSCGVNDADPSGSEGKAPTGRLPAVVLDLNASYAGANSTPKIDASNFVSVLMVGGVRARDLAQDLPTVGPDDPALTAARLIADGRLPGIAVGSS